MNPSSSAPAIAVTWRLRDEALAPSGVATRGVAARVLARRLLQRDAETLKRLEGISAGEWLIFRGAADDLPWADGAIYLGRDAAAPALLLPTLWHSAPDAALLQRALKNRFPNDTTLAVVPPCAHRDAAKNAAAATDEATPQNPNAAPVSPPLAKGARVLAGAPTLVFSLKNARRVSRAPLEQWLRAQGEEPPAAPSLERNGDEENEVSGAISPIGDLRLNEVSLAKSDDGNTRAAEEKR